MAELRIRENKIIENIEKLTSFLDAHSITWTLITKILGGNKKILKEIITNPAIKLLHSVGDSRLMSLERIKSIRPEIVTMYIKPPAMRYVPKVVKCADISLNSSYETIKAINVESKRLHKIHKVIVMIEMGELREGIIRENIMEFYDRVFQFSNVEIIGLGTNLGCMYGVEPTYDKLIQLSIFRQLIESRFSKNIPLISGGSSITLPLIEEEKIPKAVNHFRIGEAVFMGTSPLDNKKFDDLAIDAFEFDANIIELEKKLFEPEGPISEANIGHTQKLELPDGVRRSYRAICDFGVLDVDISNIIPKDDSVSFFGSTSDMTVYDVGKNKESGTTKYRVGDKLKFTPNYMAVARLMNSKFISKVEI